MTRSTNPKPGPRMTTVRAPIAYPLARRLRILSIEEETTVPALMTEAIRMLLASRNIEVPQ